MFMSANVLHAYERLQGPTEVLYWNKTNAYAGYTFFGVRSNTYLLNMEGRVVHTWPLGTNPRLLTNGNILDATSGDVSGFATLKELDWNGSTVWQYTEARTNYAPHHDFIRIYNPKPGTNTTLYIAAKTVSSNACIAAGCNPANGPYTNAQVDAVVEVDMAGNVIWEWCFFDHGIQDFDASKSNYVGAGKSISNYVGRLNLNLPGRPVTNDWLHCNSIDYNQTLDQIVITAAGGEFYVIDHGNTFVVGNPASSIALAASTNGDFLYRFGDPARYSQGNPPSINQNWTTSTTGNKQIGGASHAQWIASGLPGAGQFLVYNNGGDLFETTPQSYIFQLNGYLNASTNDTGAYVNPPSAGYNNWAAPGHDTDKRTKFMSRQITWMYYSMANQGMFSHLDSSVQRLPNGNTLICDSTEGHIFEVTATGDAVWEYVNPVSADGIITYKRDSYPMQNAVFRAYRFATNHSAFAGRILTPASTISGQSPSYISAPSISGTSISPATPTAATSVWVTSLITNSRSVASAMLTYIVGTSTNTVTMIDDGAHQDGATGDGVFGGQIPAFPAGTNVSYYILARDEFDLAATDPLGTPANRYSYVVQSASLNTSPVFVAATNRYVISSGQILSVTNVATDAEAPPQTLTYSLLTAPAGASINAANGIVTWLTTTNNAGSSNLFRVIVTDNGTPALSATKSFTVFVRSLKPNIVIIVTDDHGYADISAHGCPAPTPNMDRLGSEGIRLERFYATPVCSVTRATLLTGRNPVRTSVNNSRGLDLYEHTLPQTFKAAGFQTFMCGKWHLGGLYNTHTNTLINGVSTPVIRENVDYQPQNRGWDVHYGEYTGAINYLTHVSQEFGQYDWWLNGQTNLDAGWSTDLLADKAVQLLQQRDPSKPAVLYLAFNAVHGPVSAPTNYLNKYLSVTNVNRRATLAALDQMDVAIGRVLASLDAEGITTNTIVTFFGDNGGQASTGGSNLPLRGDKGDLYDGAIHTPAAIRWPGVLPSGVTNCHQFLWVGDLFPTLCAAAGVTPLNTKAFDGTNVWPLLMSANNGAFNPTNYRGAPLVSGSSAGSAILDVFSNGTNLTMFKLIRDKLPGVGAGYTNALFDIIADPYETTDLIGVPTYASIVATLTNHYDAIKSESYSPYIGVQPQSQTVAAGSNVTLWAMTTVYPKTVNCQWRKNGTNILGATNFTTVDLSVYLTRLDLTNVATSDAGSYDVVVTDNAVGWPTSTNSLSAVLTVLTGGTSNTPPTLAAPLDRTVNPGYALLVTNVASDSDLPAQTLTFSLLNAPANASINATSGVVTFTPGFLQLGTTNLITVVVTDSGSPAMSATNSLKAIVIANTSPVLAAVANLTVSPGSTLVIASSASDAEVPPQVLTYELVDGPVSATINATNGMVTWLPTQADAGTTNEFLVVVEDNGVPSLIDWQWFTVIVSGTPLAPVSYDVLLGRPTDTSIAVSALASNDLQVYLEYGTQSGVYTGQTAPTALTNAVPQHLTLSSLTPNQRYYYRLRYSTTGGAPFSASPERTFVTQRARGSTFTFDLEADPHHRDNDPAVWRVALTNMLADQPDFLMDLGDTFMEEKLSATNAYYLTQPGIIELHKEVRTGFFSILGHSVPTFLVNGNHEAELGWLLTGTNAPGVWGTQARQYYHPVPAPGGFYSGATNIDPFTLGPRDGYYAFEWGEALFVALDPFWFTSPKPGLNGWSWTLGTNQYAWLKQTLESSTAKFKFVFVHHLVGGAGGGEARGGLENAPYFEWGGYNTNCTWGFTTNRPGWAMPIQSLLLSNGVQAVFHGHDHLYVKQDLDANGDGITDLVYQEVPQPSRTNYNSTGAAAGYGYTNGVLLGNSGHLRVTVSPTNAQIEYVRAFLPTDQGVGKTNRMISHSYTITAPAAPVNPGTWSMAKLPDTGQTQNYTGTSGEDSDYSINPPSFTDNGDGTVTDNVTGLIWQKVDGGEMTWSNAVLYATTNRVGGQSDWRLPTAHEAFSILNQGTVSPALNTNVFTLSAAQYWWTADTQVSDATRVWAINAGGGIGAHRQDETISAGGTFRYHVRCVRGALSGQPVHHFTNNLDGTVTDLDTGLTWQQAEGAAMNWESALQYAEALSLGGKSDWRLPNLKELQSINDESRSNPSLDTNFFAGANTSRHWSSTTVMNLTNRAWWVDFQLGLVSYDDKATNLFVRCVRGGLTNSTSSTNSFAAQFVKIPAGSYQMGDHFGFVDPAHPSDEVPVHNVAVDSFYMETTLLTCTEYVQFLNSTLAQGLVEVRSNYVYGVGGTNIYCDTYGSDTNSRVQWSSSAFSVRDGRELHPITGIRWFGAIAYCNWASARDGFNACYNLATGDCVLTNSGYRLPTEADWEYAARGGLYTPYGMFPWGSDTNADGTLANWAGKTNPFTTGAYPLTTPVGFYNGSLQSKTNFNWPSADATYQTRNNMNGFGLYDMSGNVWEWINDWYASDYYTNCVRDNVVTNPPGPLTGSLMPDGKPYRGLRGGNWFNGQDQYGHARVANRNPSYFRGPGDPNGPWYHIGFRVMRRGYTSVVATGSTLTNFATGLHFTEGPAADAAGNVFFSDIPADTIYKWSVSNQLSIFRTNSGGANGLFFDATGNLLACEGDNGRLTSITPQGSVSVVTSKYAGLRFNEPNDLWIDPAGGVYFTDPTYFGHAVVQGGEYVYYLKPDRSAVLRVVMDAVRPNGLVGTPDGKTLYLADWGATNVFRYGINGDGTLTNKTSFARVKCDGMTLDAEGNLYFCESAVLVYDSAGNLVEQIAVPERPTNLEFGGSDRKTLFITTDAGSLYSLRMRVAGATNAGVTTNQPPVIASVAITPAIPTTNDTVWVTALVTDDASVSNVTLTYSTGSGGASLTNTVFLETMATNAVKPWTGAGCNNAWTVTGNVFEQRSGANSGAGNTNGLEFKGGTTNLTDNMVATTSTINAQGSSGFVEFWMQTLILSNQYGNAGWTFQLDAGSGYVTRLSELTSTNHAWRQYHYDLQPGELVSTLKMRFQFRGGSTESRIDLDQISVKVVTGGSGTSTNVVMLDDGTHHDDAAGDGTYGASIPPRPAGTTVNYYLTATDSSGLITASPVGAPASTFSYTVQTGASNTIPVIASTTLSPSSPTATNSVWVTAQVTDNLSVATVTLTYNAGAGAVNVAMLDDGLHQDGTAGDRTYGGQIPAFPAGTSVSYYLTATDNQGAVSTDPVGAPASSYSYTVRSTSTTQTAGLFLNTPGAWPGYTLMAPMHHTNTYLINNAGEVVHRWTSTYEPGRSAYLMTNGHMFRAGMVKQGGPSTGGGEGGRIEEYDWDGNLVWAIDYFSPTYIHHHDFKVLPNGNVLLLVAEKRTLAEVIAAGFNTNLLDASIFTQGYMLPDCLVEVTPTRPYGGTVVWEWHLWDHMIQDHDASKNNYGIVADHPELIDVNGTGQRIPQFWNHVNGIDHNAQLEQVMLSIRGNSELFVIDHQLTTAQAATHTGGRYNKGGDILYRWGNPAQYNRGTSGNQQLYQQHHTHWIETNCPGAGNILIFNNGIGRGCSTINQIVPPVDAAGNYTITAGAAFGPTTPVWTYQSSPPTNFYSAEISGAQRLPNGNTLICEGIKGNLFEVTAAGQTVWRYMCPVTTTIMTQGDTIPIDPARPDQFMNAVFRVMRYPTNYVGLLGRDLTSQGAIELPVDQTVRIVNSQGTVTGRQFGWSSLPDKNYAILYKATLTAPSWTSIATNRSIGTLTYYTDTNAARLGQPQGFYRIVQVP